MVATTKKSVNKIETTRIAAIAKNILLAPIYLYQGRKVKRDTVRLPEPKGARHGSVKLNTSNTVKTGLPTLNVMIVGDSSAAGVGSQSQEQALVGRLIPALAQQAIITSKFSALNWSLQATTGHTSFDILRRLYVLPTPDKAVDVMVLSLGVNDTTSNVATQVWRQQLEDIIKVAKRKFGAKTLIFSSLPPMAKMPALPAPLNEFIGAKANKLDVVLQQVCNSHQDVHYMTADFMRMAEEHNGKKHSNSKPVDGTVMFASDGFHPSAITYSYWAEQLSDLIAALFNDADA